MATIREKGVPTRTTKGAVGDIYTNIITGKSYKCTNAYRVGDEGDYFWQPMADVESVKEEPKKVEKKAEVKTEPVVEEAKNDGEPVVSEPVKESSSSKKQKVNYAKAFEANEQ